MKDLSREEQAHIGMSQVVFGSFLIMCSKYSDILEWKIDNWTAELFKNTAKTLQGWEIDGLTEKQISPEDITIIKTLVKNRGNKMFVATNNQSSKFLNVEYNRELNKSYAYLSSWDSEYLNIPSLSFIISPDNASFAQFESLFERFVKVKSSNELNEFHNYIKNKYP